MSMAQTIESTSCTATVLEVMTCRNGKKAVQVLYIDGVARPDLVNKKSGWFDLNFNAVAGDVVKVTFAPERDKWFGGIRYVPTVVEI